MPSVAGERLVSRLRRQVFASLISRDVAYFDTRSTVRRPRPRPVHERTSGASAPSRARVAA
jgi:hypothetical protein